LSFLKCEKVDFVGNLTLNTGCEFHFDDFTVASVINIIGSVLQGTASCYSFFCGQKDLTLMPFTPRCMQCINWLT